MVAHARGVDFLMKDAKDANGNKLAKAQFIADAAFVPSGVAEVTRLRSARATPT